ncbi:metal-dependent hydrolase [Candidatus Woesearchaeota archaeon]|nr:metal-dependent hydrolase [Candidatus Woesearchaeota archaeon]
MPFAVAHILFPLLLADMYRNFGRRGRKISRRMALFAGISGLLPDLDIPVFIVASHFGSVPITSIHRTVTHSLVLPVIGVMFFFLFLKVLRTKSMHVYALLFAFGTLSHVFLDGTINGTVMPFYPFNSEDFGLDLVSLAVPSSVLGSDLPYRFMLLAVLDAVLLVLWLLYEEYKGRIRDYV